jgi:hypothetical protein
MGEREREQREGETETGRELERKKGLVTEEDISSWSVCRYTFMLYTPVDM